MKKITALLIALALMVAMACPAFADGFTESPGPNPPVELVEVDGYVGTIRDANGEVVARIPAGCLRITSMADIEDETKSVPEEIVELLEGVYEALLSGEMVLPYEKHGEDLSSDNMTMRTMFDIRFTCEEHKAMLEQEGYTLELTLKANIDADVIVYTMVYDEEAEEESEAWTPVISTVNNNDGTVTCVFDRLCVVELSLEKTEE